MEPLEIRDRRYRIQKQIGGLDPEDSDGIKALEAEISRLRELCPHEHREESEDDGLWRCRDCDIQGALEPATGGQEAGDQDEADGGSTGGQ